jgi:hypothetical protein
MKTFHLSSLGGLLMAQDYPLEVVCKSFQIRKTLWGVDKYQSVRRRNMVFSQFPAISELNSRRRLGNGFHNWGIPKSPSAWIGDGSTAKTISIRSQCIGLSSLPVILSVVNNRWAISSFNGIAEVTMQRLL